MPGEYRKQTGRIYDDWIPAREEQWLRGDPGIYCDSEILELVSKEYWRAQFQFPYWEDLASSRKPPRTPDPPRQERSGELGRDRLEAASVQRVALEAQDRFTPRRRATVDCAGLSSVQPADQLTNADVALILARLRACPEAASLLAQAICVNNGNEIVIELKKSGTGGEVELETGTIRLDPEQSTCHALETLLVELNNLVMSSYFCDVWERTRLCLLTRLQYIRAIERLEMESVIRALSIFDKCFRDCCGQSKFEKVRKCLQPRLSATASTDLIQIRTPPPSYRGPCHDLNLDISTGIANWRYKRRSAVIVRSPTSAWIALPGALWISTNESSETTGNSTVEYHLEFCLCGDFNAVSLNMQFSADNEATIWLNGTVLAMTPPALIKDPDGASSIRKNYQMAFPAATSAPEMFRKGKNVLEIAVKNLGQKDGYNASGLIVSGSITGFGGCQENEPVAGLRDPCASPPPECDVPPSPLQFEQHELFSNKLQVVSDDVFECYWKALNGPKKGKKHKGETHKGNIGRHWDKYYKKLCTKKHKNRKGTSNHRLMKRNKRKIRNRRVDDCALF